MHVYNTSKYGQNKYSQGDKNKQFRHLLYGSCVAGIEVRKQIGHKYIYRRRRGNGFAGSDAKVIYQDRYKYVVPGNINNVENQPWRTTFKAAVDYWYSTLTLEEKKEYTTKGNRKKRIPGHNQFVSEVLKGEFSMFVNRGDPATQDFTVTDFTRDNVWHELDLALLIPTIARATLFHLKFEATQKDEEILFRKQGNVNALNVTGGITKQTDKHQYKTIIVATGASRKIEYKATSNNISVLSLTVRGWWT